VTPASTSTTSPNANPSAEARPTRARRGEGELLRDQILEATRELLLEKGDVDAVSIRAVAERVGKTPPSIYLHFADKGQLILAVCEQGFQELAEFSRAAQSPYDDPVDRIRACGKAYVRFALDHPEQYRILFMEPAGKPEALDPFELTFDGLKQHVAFRSLYDNVARGFEEGRFVGSGPELTSLAMWAAIHGIASLLIAKPFMDWPSVDVFVDTIFDQHLAGLLPRE
jgi:AcrR family transcriptional regulator